MHTQVKLYKHEVSADIFIFHLTGKPGISVWPISNSEEYGPVPFPKFISTTVHLLMLNTAGHLPMIMEDEERVQIRVLNSAEIFSGDYGVKLARQRAI